MLAIMKRELSSYFFLITGYVLLAGFYILSGILFFITSLVSKTTNLNHTFNGLFFIVVLSIPILTMRLFSEEMKQKTDQALLTAPVSLISIVLGKYIAATIMFFLCIFVTLIYALVVSFYGFTDWPVVFGNFIGLFLLGLSFISIGMFISSLTENQIVSAFSMFGIGFFIMILDNVSQAISMEMLAKFLNYISFIQRYKNFTVGILKLTDVVFFLSVSALFIFLTVRVLEKRRWS